MMKPEYSKTGVYPQLKMLSSESGLPEDFMRKTIFALTSLLTLAGCAEAPMQQLPSNPPLPGANTQTAAPVAENSQTNTMAAYGYGMIRQLDNDLFMQQILANCEVGHSAGIGIIVEPNGYVDHAVMVKSSLPANVEQLLLQHVIYVNFGAFPAGFPNQKLTFMLPLHPPANPAALPPLASVYSMHQIVLFQPNQMLVNRLTGAAQLAFYIRQINGSVNALLASQPAQTGFSAALVIGIKPGGQSRAWLVGPVPPALASQIETVVQAVPTIPVHNGPVAVAIEFSAWGGGIPLQPGPPIPPEWLQGAPATPELIPDGPFARIWP